MGFLVDNLMLTILVEEVSLKKAAQKQCLHIPAIQDIQTVIFNVGTWIYTFQVFRSYVVQFADLDDCGLC